MKWFRAGSAALVVVALAGCKSFDGLTDLEVINQNAADRERVLQTWGDNENFTFGAFNAVYNAYMESGYIGQPTTTMADEQSISWGNFDGRILSSEPRTFFNNSPSYSYNNHAETPWFNAYEGLSTIYDGLKAFNEDTTGIACVEVDCDRINAYGKFVQGMGHGILALFFDSAFVIDETIALFDADGAEVVQPFVPYQVMWDSALSYFDQAIAGATGATWTIPSAIFGASGNQWTGDELAAVAHSMVAAWAPQMNRTTAERAAVDWNRVISSAGAGMAGDIMLEGDGCDKWCNDYVYFSHITTSTTWNRADYKTIGQYDENSVAGNGTYGYVDWLNEATPARTEFPMVGHPDGRIVGAGDTDGTTDGTNFKYRGPSRFPSSRGTYHYSLYSNSVYEGYPPTESGPMPWILRAHVDLNMAEGMHRMAGATTQGVIDIVNVTRGAAGLPNLTLASSYDVVLDAIYYERAIENFAACHGCQYFHHRGEGALANTQGTVGGGFDKDGAAIQHHQGPVEGTPMHFAPPGKELEILQRPIYTYGGVGSELAAGQGLASPPAFDASTAAKYSISGWYMPVEEVLQRRAERVNKSKSLVRYVN